MKTGRADVQALELVTGDDKDCGRRFLKGGGTDPTLALKVQFATLGKAEERDPGEVRIGTGRTVTTGMHAKVLAGLLLVTFIGTSFSRSVPMLYHPQGDGGLSRQAKAVPGAERMLRSGNGRLVRREWPGHLSLEQKHLISQFLPHLYAGMSVKILSHPAELIARENNLQDADPHFPSWMDFGRRSTELAEEDA